MKFIPPETRHEDGSPGYTVLAYERETLYGLEGEPQFGTILVVRTDDDKSDGTWREWIVWSVRLDDGMCFQGSYMHERHEETQATAFEEFERRAKRRRAR